MDFSKRYKTSKAHEENGVWIVIRDVGKFLIARAKNSKYRAALREAYKPHQEAVKAGTMDPDVEAQMILECSARHLLLDWEGVKEDGEDVPYSYEKALEYLTEFQDFQDDIALVAGDMEAYRAEALKDDLGNSQAS